MKCGCPFGPRCESNRNCVDEAAMMGVKDRRTGTIRARAEWSIMHGWSRGPTPRVLFYCDACLKSLDEAMAKPIIGITRPPHASEDWKPSITAHIVLAAMEVRQRERARQPPPAISYDEDFVIRYGEKRISRWTPQQLAQAKFVHNMLRSEDARK
jgi:hypothetical protein